MTIEEAVKNELREENSTLAQLALLLARNLDLGEGGAAAVRELRAILRELREKRGTYAPARLNLLPSDDDEEDAWPPEGGLWINGKKVS